MKKLLFATALVASAAAFADGPLNAISFEGYSADATFTNGTAEKDEEGVIKSEATYGYFFFEGDTDGSSVKAFGSGEGQVAEPGITRPLYFANGAMGKYLELSTEGGILWRSINTLNIDNSGESPDYSLGDPQAIAATGTYLDTLVQFTPTEDGGAPEVDGADKLAIWLNVDSSGASPVTNLMVKAGFVDDNGTDTTQTPTTYTLTTAAPVVAGQWYRLTIKAIADVTQQKAKNPLAYETAYTGFEIYLDGVLLAATAPAFGQGFIDLATDAGEFGWLDQTADASLITYLRSGTVFPALGLPTTTATLQGVGFKGSGALDDIVWTTDDPFDVPAAAFTLTWPAGVTPVSYSIDGGTAESLTGQTSSFSIPGGVVPGSTVAFTFTNADGATKTMEVVASASVNDIDAEDAVYVWADYLGAAVAGAYTIDDANDLDMLRKGVAAGLATVGETFNQTANIDMTSADPFAGIGTYHNNLLDSTSVPFCGTYDGQGFTISNITFTDRDYAGIFNQVKGGTIKDLTVDTITFPGVGSKCSAAIVGNAGLGATLQGLTAAGSFGTQANPAKHNVAGIAIRVCGGASNVVDGVVMLETLVKDCTNNATLYGNYTKAAGITALTQDQNGVPNDYVLFDGCVNNGNIVMVTGTGTEGRDGLGGILGYVADGTKMQNCVNNGTLTSVLATAKIGEIIGWAQGRTLDDLGGNAAASDKKMIGDPAGSTITGFKYATVASNVATTVLPPLTAGATYLLEGDVAASETPVATLTAVGDTISFDTALGYTFAGTVASSGAAGYPVASTSGTVTTYTAGYFPRTATAGQDGSASNPFELADADDLQALKAVIPANTTDNAYRSLCYKVVANIDATDLGYWDGIGTQGTANTGFKGTLDGGNYTISNLKFSPGKYRAFFNRLDNATIKDLTINVTGFQDTNAEEHGYAAFAGNMKASLLLNCTATGTIGTTAKPAMHTCAGLAVKVDSVGTFVNCTNHIDIVCSLTDNPKIGGIVGLMQGGALTNCWNDGDLTITVKTCGNDGNGAGGLVGYAQTTGYTISGGGNAGTVQSTDTTTAASDKYEIHVGTIVGKTGSALTAVDGVVAQADAISAGVRANVNGLDFATVDNNVATFVSTLESNNTYKVMLGGATATYAFADAGTIAFDTNLVQNVTFNITAAEGLTVTDATSAGVVTFTAGAPAPAYPTYLDNADAAVKANYDTWAGTNGADANSVYEKQFLLNAAPATEVPATALAITAIEQNETAGWDITVECTISGVDLTGTVGTAKAGNGYLAVSYTDDLGGTWTTENIAITAVANGKVTVNVNKSGAKFMKVKLSSTAEPQN